ncbi:MAG: hypothetical protein KKI09_16965 [Spirochaetes bacterium]|nr:hypothetical protein [Spirochaetota bacterium]MBU0957118.1 hypothetical protein [Spirochaetota bacterium]
MKISILVLFAFSLAGCLSLRIVPVGATSSRGVSQTNDLDSIMVGNNDRITLQAGTYTGRLVIEANNASINGAGVGKTIIRGDVVINGNSNRVRNLTILGSVSISGNTNELSRVELDRSRVSVQGNKNKY